MRVEGQKASGSRGLRDEGFRVLKKGRFMGVQGKISGFGFFGRWEYKTLNPSFQPKKLLELVLRELDDDLQEGLGVGCVGGFGASGVLVLGWFSGLSVLGCFRGSELGAVGFRVALNPKP